MNNAQTKNKIGQWVEAIPEPWFYRPFFLNIMACNCGKMFCTREAYEGHYALRHILSL